MSQLEYDSANAGWDLYSRLTPQLHNRTLGPSQFMFISPPRPADRRPISFPIFFTEFLPLVLCYYASAISITLHNTLTIRVALLPITIWLAWNAGTTILVEQPELNHLNYAFLIVLMVVVMRCIEWTLREQPYHRTRGDKRSLHVRSSLDIARNAFELCFNLRGHGWDWGRSCPFQPPSSITSSFTLDTIIRLTIWLFLFDAFHIALQSLDPSRAAFSHGIFQNNLNILSRYMKSSFISLLTGACICSGITAVYQACALFGVTFLGQDRRDWPIIFDSPWKSRSLADFWGRRWHQVFRRNFLIIGGKPFLSVFGKAGGVVGVFLISAIIHDIPMWGMGQGMEFQAVGGYFLIQGLGIIVESAIEQRIGWKMEGYHGGLWTLAWTVLPANLIVDAWLRRGLAACMFLPDATRPTLWLMRISTALTIS